MKIGVITFHRADNYGAVLQTYALQNFIKINLCDCEIINYYSEEIERKSSIPKRKNYDSSLTYFKSLLMHMLYIGRHRKFELFRTKMNISPQYTKHDLEKANDRYDIVLTGSDQVWNWNCSKGDTAYFLDFITDNKKKNSYAASFAISEIPQELKDRYYYLLKDFNAISVRERKGKEIVSSLLNREATVSLDPAFLIKKEEWEKIAKKPNLRDKYILIYQLTVTEELIEFAERLSEKTGCKLVIIPNTIKNRIKAKYYFNISPEEWLGLFCNAQYIITNTFHGVAFSIIMNKPFFVEVLPNRVKTTSRIDNILELFDLNDRKITNLSIKQTENNIDWATINEKIDKERRESLKYLEELCSEG